MVNGNFVFFYDHRLPKLFGAMPNAHSTQKVHIYPKSLLPTGYGERDYQQKGFRGLPLSQ